MMQLADSERFDFESLNIGFNTVFTPNRLSIGLVVPIEHYAHSAVPSMAQHIERVQLAKTLGFSSVWLRDVPFDVPSFGDAGQTFDPFVYLGALAASTRTIALGVSSIILPLRHPAHVAKAAATADVLSAGRLLLGIASGDRPDEYPAVDVEYRRRGDLFRESYAYIRQMAKTNPRFSNHFGRVSNGMNMLPKPVAHDIPLLVTGSSQQSPEWIANNANGWMTYPRPTIQQAQLIQEFRRGIRDAGITDKPVMEPLYIDLVEDPKAKPEALHLGLRLGIDALRDYLQTRESIGLNHIALNLRFNRADVEKTLNTIANDILPDFNIGHPA